MGPASTQAGASVYSPAVLRLYDCWVLGLSNRFVWKCPTKTVLLPFFKEHIGRRHLDVGVGTGFYLAHAGLGPVHEITLLDLNDNSLRAAAARIKQRKVRILQQDVMHPLARTPERSYDSISLFYVLHCLPGTMREKEPAIANLKRYLKRDGVIYGATILGDEANHNLFGRLLLKTYNRRGIFSNAADTTDALQAMLKNGFKNVKVWQHNNVALFVARDPYDVG